MIYPINNYLLVKVFSFEPQENIVAKKKTKTIWLHNRNCVAFQCGNHKSKTEKKRIEIVVAANFHSIH